MGVLKRYWEYLPVSDKTPLIDLNEGSTPLVRSCNIAERLGIRELYFKCEGQNPTGSFKDRGMVVAVAKAKEKGSNVIVCASTGNTSASAAAYAARSNMRAIVIVPKGNIAMNKLAQALIYGAKVVALEGNFDHALQVVKELAQQYNVTLVNSINPDRLEGQKTAAFEIVDDLGDAPDYLVLPVGNAGNITAYWKGFKEYYSINKCTKLPKIIGGQAEGAAPLVLGHPVNEPKTIASAIRIGNPASWKGAIQAKEESGGLIESVSDQEILQAQMLLASLEGIFAEPASATSLAVLIKCIQQNRIDRDTRIVCILTGHGLKDPDTVLKNIEPPIELEGDARAIAKVLKF
jgi:threonine synthase